MRWIDSSDSYKAKMWKAEFTKQDFAAQFARIEAEAKKVSGRPAQVARRLEELRKEWRSVQRHQRFAETGSFE